MSPSIVLLHLPLLLALACDPTPARSDAEAGRPPWTPPAQGWRTDPVWYDGQAEKLTYRAVRTIYGLERPYVAVAYTNKQQMDPATTTKASAAAEAGGVEVFKHHWSERVETERYDYDFSTAAFVRTDDLSLFKLTASTQEDCGSSFKQVWRDGKRFAFWESVYFPDAGVRQGRIAAASPVFEDALGLVLRDYPFREGAEGVEHTLQLVPSQKSTRRVPLEARPFRLRARGPEELALPVGTLSAWRVELLEPGADAPRATYWFAEDGSAPWLHALVRYEGPGGVRYELAGRERTAYWER